MTQANQLRKQPFGAAAVALVGYLGAVHPILAEQSGLEDEQQYQTCMSLAREVPEEARESALAWQARGGGAAARHCAAVALIGLGRHADAAAALERLGDELAVEQPDTAAEILGQAGQAWGLAEVPARAYAATTEALALSPDDVELLVDRAIAAAALDDYGAALVDLNKAHDLAPRRADILVYRASARRYLDELELALADIEAALELAPEDVDALLERGIIRRLAGDTEGARADWLQVVVLGAGTPAAEAARTNLERMDVNPD